MDKLFNAYSEKYEDALTKLTGKTLVSYDTSCLLNLYRCTKEARKEVVDLFKSIDETFGHFVVHHVALEFSVNKEKAKKDTENVFSEVVQTFNKFKKTIQGVTNVGGLRTPLSDLSKNIAIPLQAIHNELEKGKNNLFKKNEAENIFEIVSELFSGKVSKPFNSDEIQLITTEGVSRYEKRIPPGFEDGSKSDYLNFNGVAVETKFGDLIIWKQLIEYSKVHKSNIIFITSEEKKDWMAQGGNMKFRIRPDLASEFNFETGLQIFCLSVKDFESEFKKKLKYSFSSDTKKELESIEKESNSWLDDIKQAFEYFKGEAELKQLYVYLEAHSQRTLPPTWQSTVRRTIYNHSSDVNAYLGRADLFERTSKGQWKLRDL